MSSRAGQAGSRQRPETERGSSSARGPTKCYGAPMSLKLPALDPASLPPRSTSSYPEPYRSRVLPREKRAIGAALGLAKIGVNLTTLPPGKESSMRHWHTHEEEIVFIVE